MLTFKLAEDRHHLQLIHHDTKGELKDLQLYFRKRQKGYHFNALYKRKLWDGYDKFLDKDLKIGVGLWKEIINFGKKYEYEVTIEGLSDLLNLDFTKDQLDKFASVLLDGTSIDPRDYQLEAAHRALKYKFCSQELATSAGKTLILFLYLSFLKRKGIVSKTKKALIVVPSITLVGQTAEKFEKDYKTGLLDWTVLQIGGSNKYSDKLFESSDLVISTYQSLKNKPPEFFKQFSCLCIDECLHPDSLISMADGSIQRIADVKIGDYVITQNDITGELQSREVEYVYKNLSVGNKLYEIELENGDRLKITGNHKVRLTSGQWMRVDELSIEDDICINSVR